METAEVRIHGHRVRYRRAGNGGPLVVLLHGIAGSGEDWAAAIDDLAVDHTVVAPDLLGHGESAKPRGDYSLGAYASGVRDLLEALGHHGATIVGHSLGGGVALQFAYLFPERCERLVLVSSGGLGAEVSVALRAASLPGAELVLPLITHPALIGAGNRLGRMLRAVGLRPAPTVAQSWTTYQRLASTEARQAFLHTLRSIVDVRGQRVSATDRLYLAADVPTLLVWGENDRVIPVAHAHAASEQLPASELVTFPGVGHFPHQETPSAFTRAVTDFMARTTPRPADARVGIPAPSSPTGA